MITAFQITQTACWHDPIHERHCPPHRRPLFRDAHRSGSKLRFLGRFDANGASVGLQALPVDHPLCGGNGTDNCVAIFSDRYPDQPLVVQGPGAGAEVTAAALLDDVLRIV